MEKVIRDAGGCSDFVATITYINAVTQIPSSYKFEYVLMGNEITDEFENVNPDEQNAQTSSIGTQPQENNHVLYTTKSYCFILDKFDF